MGILGIGIDIVSLQRIVDVAQRRSARKLAQRVLSPIEFSEWHSRKVATGSSFDSSRFLAVRCVMVFLLPMSLILHSQMGCQGSCVQSDVPSI